MIVYCAECDISDQAAVVSSAECSALLQSGRARARAVIDPVNGLDARHIFSQHQINL